MSLADSLCQTCINPVAENETVCKECTEYKPVDVNWAAKEEELKAIVEKHKGKGKFDVIVPFTGGKDSSYVLYYFTQVLKLRALVITWDNGLFRDKALENMKRIVKATNSEHRMYKWESQNEVLRSMFFRYSKICYCPIFMAFGAIPLAAKENIPLIFTGFSEGQREMDHSFQIPSDKVQKGKIIEFMRIWKKVVSMALNKYDKKHANAYIQDLLGDLIEYCNNIDKATCVPVFVPLSNYKPWTNISQLEQQLGSIGWENPNNSSVHSSCKIESIKGYLESERGLHEVRSEMNQMIRIGSISREQALVESEKMCMNKGGEPDSLDFFCDFFDITRDRFNKTVEERRNYRFIAKAVYLKTVDRAYKTVSWLMGLDNHEKTWKPEDAN